jgi:hypothetical protein
MLKIIIPTFISILSVLIFYLYTLNDEVLVSLLMVDDDNNNNAIKSTLDSVLFYQVPRNMVPEMEPSLKEIETLFIPVEEFDLYDYKFFTPNSQDSIFQYISNRSFNMEWGKEMYYYERESKMLYKREKQNLTAEVVAHNIPSNMIGPDGEKGKRLIYTMKRTTRTDLLKNWMLNSGTLVHKYIKTLSIKYSYESKGETIEGIKGLFYYPPGGFREWHTNMFDDTSWRMYYINATEDGKSWFRYVPPGTNKTVVVPDKSGYFNMFRLRSKKDEIIWHSVYSDTHRFSVGFKIPPALAYKIILRMKKEEEEEEKKRKKKKKMKK